MLAGNNLSLDIKILIFNIYFLMNHEYIDPALARFTQAQQETQARHLALVEGVQQDRLAKLEITHAPLVFAHLASQSNSSLQVGIVDVSFDVYNRLQFMIPVSASSITNPLESDVISYFNNDNVRENSLVQAQYPVEKNFFLSIQLKKKYDLVCVVGKGQHIKLGLSQTSTSYPNYRSLIPFWSEDIRIPKHLLARAEENRSGIGKIFNIKRKKGQTLEETRVKFNNIILNLTNNN